MSYMFYECEHLPNISQLDTSNVINMSYMFFRCHNLPNISQWNTSNVINMSYMFSCCENIPDISQWNTSNATNMVSIFSGCTNLPKISQWNTSNTNNFNLLILKSSPINIQFYDSHHGRKINIIGDDFMTFSNLVQNFYERTNISSNTNNVKFYFNNMEIDPNSNELLKDLNITNHTKIEFYSY